MRETACCNDGFAAQQRGRLSDPRTHAIAPSDAPLPHFGHQPRDSVRQQKLPLPHRQHVIVSGHFGRRIEIAGGSILRTVHQHQPAETALARTPQRPHARHGQLLRQHVFDADHAVAGRKGRKLDGITQGIEHHDHFIVGIFGRKQVFDLLLRTDTAAQHRYPDTVGRVARHGVRTCQQQPFVMSPHDKPEQREGRSGDSGKQQ